jgi:hypothetical protein
MNFSKAAYKERRALLSTLILRSKIVKCWIVFVVALHKSVKWLTIWKTLRCLNNTIPQQQCSQQDFLSVAPQPICGQGRPIVEVSISLTDTHSRWDSSERVISSSQRLLPTQQTQETNIHSLSGIQTHDPSNQTAEYLRLTTHGHRKLHTKDVEQMHHFP